MVPLALGVCGDFFVVVRKITESTKSAVAASIVSLLFFYGLWFGLSIYRRNQKRSLQNVTEHDRRQFAS